MPESQSDWLDALVAQIEVERPTGALVISSGHSPSGTYHIGTLREIMTANAITWALKRSGRDARHVDFVDDFDAFRKVPTGIGVPDSWSQYLGQPLRLVPDPFDCHTSYGEHFLTQLHEGLAAIGAMPDETLSGYDLYRDGTYVDQIVASLDQLDEVRKILTEVGGRQLDERWAPVQILDENNNLRNRRFDGWEKATLAVKWIDRDDKRGSVPINDGQVKLDWRLDWPGRWAKWKVSVEPFGRDHATKGGSYDTGQALVRQIFGGEPPVPVPYEFINPVDDTVKMSKSSGNVLTPLDALEVMPPELLRYFIVKNRPGRTLVFDSGLGLYQLIDQFVRERDSTAAGIAYASSVTKDETISSVPFSHLVAVSQAAAGDSAAIRKMLTRTGYESAAKDEWSVIQHELRFVASWLAKYAPDSVKFELQTELPEVELSDQQKALLAAVASAIESFETIDAQTMHQTVYEASLARDLKPAEAFQALYRVLLNQDSGPKAGWFLASLAEQDKSWLMERLRLEK